MRKIGLLNTQIDRDESPVHFDLQLIPSRNIPPFIWPEWMTVIATDGIFIPQIGDQIVIVKPLLESLFELKYSNYEKQIFKRNNYLY